MDKRVDSLYSEIGRRIFAERDKKGLTQAQLASKVSLSRTSITNIEKGKQKILVHVLLDISSALQINPTALLPDSDIPLEKKVVNKYIEEYSNEAQRFAESILKSSKK